MDVFGFFVVTAIAGMFVFITGAIIKAIVETRRAKVEEQRAIAQFGIGNGLQEYRERHPDCVQRGRIICYACGGTSIWAERAFRGTECFTHRCRTCSVVLYQTAPGRDRPAATVSPVVERREPHFEG